MEQSGDKDQGGGGVYEVNTFPVPFASGEIQENTTAFRKYRC